MRGDFDRVRFDAAYQFANVLHQQGRVLLASEINEQSAIHHHFLRTLIVDLIGESWRAGDGFLMKVGADGSWSIGQGRYYVDGIQCENRADCKFEDQPFQPTQENLRDILDSQLTEFAFYLDCWERNVTWLNYPHLREPALGGPDTATRLQIAWQVWPLTKEIVQKKLGFVIKALQAQLEAGPDDKRRTELVTLIRDTESAKEKFALTCEKVSGALELLDKAPPRLTADAKLEAEHTDPCTIAADARYRGRENQLYRVEIHHPGLAKEATFKWSRECGSVAFKVLDVDIDQGAGLTRVTLESLGHDRRTGLCEGDWVELTDTDSEMSQLAPPLARVKQIDGQRRLVTLEGSAHPVDLRKQPILRRWDHAGDPKAEGALLVVESKDDSDWLELERGIRICFAPGGLYRTGDYWLIPARIGDIEWPMQNGQCRALEPHGVQHHRAVLAIVKKDTDGNWSVDEGKQCGCTWTPQCE